MNTVVLDLAFGDCGKGRVADYLVEDKKIVVKFNGGSNAGHSIVVDGKKTVLRLLPSGILRPDKICVLGQGMVINLTTLYDEIKELEKQGHKNIFERILISKS